MAPLNFNQLFNALKIVIPSLNFTLFMLCFPIHTTIQPPPSLYFLNRKRVSIIIIIIITRNIKSAAKVYYAIKIPLKIAYSRGNFDVILFGAPVYLYCIYFVLFIRLHCTCYTQFIRRRWWRLSLSNIVSVLFLLLLYFILFLYKNTFFNFAVPNT